MSACIAEADLFELAAGSRGLGDEPAMEAHLASCAACSALVAALVAAPRTGGDRSGTTLGPYRLDARIGAGAMGEVYRAWDARLHRHVAVKVLAHAFAGSHRLEAEGRAAAAVMHPNVVTVFDTGIADGTPYIVSELIVGESLRSVIDRGPVPRATAVDLVLQLARGLAAAHAHGVVHRDLKPGNLIVDTGGTLKILDFGLAKLFGDADVTQPGTVLGTTGYLAPEQARGEPADARSDLFAVGAIAYELLSGRRAFGGATFAERLSATLRDTPPPLGDALDPIVARCLEKDPAKRFQSAQDLAWAITATAGAPPRTGSSRRSFLGGIVAAGAGGVLAGRALFGRGAATPPLVPAYRQLTFRQGRVASARFTHDGASLLYSAAWEDKPLAVFATRHGGGTETLALPPAQLLAVSARGELALSLGHRYLDGFHQAGELAVVPLAGGTPRGLGIAAQHADYTPDGQQLAIVRRAGARFRLELPVGTVLHEAGWISHPRVSPDGAAVACLVHAHPNDDYGDLVLVPRSGGAPRVIAAGWSSIDGLGWTRSGTQLWISASREGGNNSLWCVDRAGAVQVHVPAAGRLRVHDLAPDGRLAVTHVSGRLRMMVKRPDAPAEIDLALSDVSQVADLSADGDTVLFAEFGDVDTANGAYVRRTDGGPALRLGDVTPFDLADDGRGVLAGIHEPRAIAIVPLAGARRVLALPGLADVRWARWCADGAILVGAAAAGRALRLWRVDRSGALAPVADEGVFGPCAVSPDGTRVALVVEARLRVLAIAGAAPPLEVPGAFADDRVCGWHAPSGDIFVRTAARPVRVRRVSPLTGAATPVVELAPPPLGLRGVDALVLSGDGRGYAYSYGQELSRLYTMTLGPMSMG